jgi:hypothetical protein
VSSAWLANEPRLVESRPGSKIKAA